MAIKRVLLGLAAGAGLMYLLDPSNGKERRQRVRDKLSEARLKLESRFGEASDEASDVVQGEYLDTYSRSRKRTDGRDRVTAAEAGGISSSSSE